MTFFGFRRGPVRGVDRNFSREGFEIFLHETLNFGGFSDFFSKNPSKLKKFSRRGGVLTPKTPPEYAPGFGPIPISENEICIEK